MSLLASRPRWAVVLAAALLALGALRLFTLVLAEPLTGYANQYDMARSSACLGLWPQGVAPRDQATPDAPRSDYRYGGARGEGCYPGTTVALAALVIAVDRGAELVTGSTARDFDLRQLGVLQALLLLGIALAFDRRLRDRPRARLLHALAFAAVLCDPFNTLYFNTLYTEAAALLALYACIALMAHLALGGRATPIVLAGFALALLALGASRVQHLALPLALATIAVLARISRGLPWRGVALAGGAAALLVLVGQLAHQSAQPGIADANRVNAVFGAVLPAAADPAAMNARLGLPAHCASLSETTWYRRHGRDPAAECPELASLSRLRVLAALATEPRAAAVLVGLGVAQSTAWRLPYVGERAGESMARSPHPSLADALAPAPFSVHAALWLAAALGPLVVAARALARRRLDAGAALALSLAATAGLGWLGSLLGDGYSELARHLHLAQVALLAMPLALLAGAREASAWSGDRVAGIVLAVAFALGLAWQRLPMAEGYIESLAPVPGAPGMLQAQGWVLDPAGADGAALRIDGVEVAAGPVEPAGDVARLFPLASGTTAGRFTLRFAAPAEGGRLELVSRRVDGATVRADALELPLQGS